MSGSQQQVSQQPVLVMAGGTGGHIFPGIAVANAIREQQVPVIWLGSRNSMEEKLVSDHGIEFFGLSISGVRGKGLLIKLLAPLKLSWAVLQACRIIIGIRPRAVIGLGGFASAPGGIAAVLLRRPLYIQEQNAIPGLTNRWLAKFSYCAFEGFAGSFAPFGIEAIHTGNPVRKEIEALATNAEDPDFSNRPARLLVIGGSLGALHLNEVVATAISEIDLDLRPDIRHQAGKAHVEITQQAYESVAVKASVTAFIDDMATAYAWADIVIARAGALTVTELMHAGKASILVPYPHAVDDHQTTNAQILATNRAAIVIADSELNSISLSQQLSQLLSSKRLIVEMGTAARELVLADSAAMVARVTLSGAKCRGGQYAAG